VAGGRPCTRRLDARRDVGTAGSSGLAAPGRLPLIKATYDLLWDVKPPLMGIRTFHRYEAPLAVVFAVGIAVAVLVTARMPERHFSLEARQRASVATDVITGASRGTQGLVGSLYLAPLPTVLIIFLGLVPFVHVTPLLSSVVAAGATAFLALYVNANWRRHEIPAALRFSAMLCILILPPVVLSIQSGQTTMVFAALTVAGVGALIEWSRTVSLRQLAFASLLLAGAVITRYQGAVVALVAVLFVFTAAMLRRRSWSFCEGTVLTFFVPSAYVILLWIGGNWLILGSPLFFLKALWSPPSYAGANLRAFLSFDCPWLLLAVLALPAFSVPLIASLVGKGARILPQRIAALAAPAAGAASIVALVAVAWFADIPTSFRTSPTNVRQMVGYLQTAYPNGTFIVSGYAGYDFIEASRPDPEHRWVHVMHLEPSGIAKVLDDYPGRQVFLLVNAGEALGRWDEVGLAWHIPGSRIPERYLFARQVGVWTVFEVLRG